MKLNDAPTLYDILDIMPDASQQEIREAYLRIKGTYSKDSVALYSLIDPNERNEMLHKIQEAYNILSNPEKRKEYDRYYGTLEEDIATHPLAAQKAAQLTKKIISIDRVPPMEETIPHDDLLIPPPTDFSDSSSTHSPQSSSHTLTSSSLIDQKPPHILSLVTAQTHEKNQVEQSPLLPEPEASYSAPHRMTTPNPATFSPDALELGEADVGSEYQPSLTREIEQETEWRGSFIRKVREVKKVSLEELSQTTKISKTYILAIEEENYSKLPAPVYVRGFVNQIARVLKLPQQAVATAYHHRYNHYYTEKNK